MSDLLRRLVELADCKHDDHSVAREAAELLEWLEVQAIPMGDWIAIPKVEWDAMFK